MLHAIATWDKPVSSYGHLGKASRARPAEAAKGEGVLPWPLAPQGPNFGRPAVRRLAGAPAAQTTQPKSATYDMHVCKTHVRITILAHNIGPDSLPNGVVAISVLLFNIVGTFPTLCLYFQHVMICMWLLTTVREIRKQYALPGLNSSWMC